MVDFTLVPNNDGTYTLLIYMNSFNCEFSEDFFGGVGKKIMIKTVKLMFLSGLVISVPFTAFAKNNYAMSYVYFGSVKEQIENVKKSEKVIKTVSPSYFDLNPDGTLNSKNISEDFILNMHDVNIKVVPFLSNHWDKKVGEAALDNGELLSTQIKEAVYRYNLDGINVDIENVNHLYRDKYTNLVKLLKKKMPDKEVSVAVAANPYGWETGWHGSYDYAELAKYSDYLMIMSYDEHYEGGEPGPVSSIDFVEKSIKYALNNSVEKEKIVIGLPFYGRLWGGNNKGSGISLKRAHELINQTSAKIYFDEKSKTPYAKFNVNNSNIILNGKPLKNGEYTLWFEDENSLREKMKLAEKYKIKGTGNWSAGQENDGIWDYYELWVKGIYFNDIAHHFAKESIIKVYNDGIMVGSDENNFAPQRQLTRGEAAVVFCRVLDIKPENNTKYSDTKGHFAEKYINALSSEGIISGYLDGTFRPNNIISRQEMAALLSRVLEIDYHGKNNFYSDVNKSLWSFEEITALTQAGIMKGYEDGTFKPFNPISRGETAVLIDRIMDK